MQLRTEVEINAPPKLVWEVLADLEAYHEWNPFITSFRGPLQEGAKVSITVSPPDSSDMRFAPVLLTVVPEREIRWKGKIFADFFFAGEHYITLCGAGENKTRVCHGEDFEGFFLKFILRQLGQTQRGFVFMNEALKRRAEARFAATGSSSS